MLSTTKNSISSYTEARERRFSVSIGKKTLKGFKTIPEALEAGIDLAMKYDNRAKELCENKPLHKQVGIIFGSEIAGRYFS